MQVLIRKEVYENYDFFLRVIEPFTTYINTYIVWYVVYEALRKTKKILERWFRWRF